MRVGVSDSQTSSCISLIYLARAPFVTRRAFLGRRRIESRAGFCDFVVATCAISMERLLVIQSYQLSADFKLNLRNFGQKLRLLIGASMTITTDNYLCCIRV